MQMRWQPSVRVGAALSRTIPVYIDALADSMQASLAKLDFEARRDPHLVPRGAEILSDEGRPLSLPMRQDPRASCVSAWAGRRIAGSWTFQSRFGPEEWLQPYTDETVKSLAESGVREDRPRGPRLLRRFALRRWRSSTARTARSSWSMAVSNSPICPASMTAPKAMRVIEHVVAA